MLLAVRLSPLLSCLVALCACRVTAAENGSDWKQRHLYFERVNLSCTSGDLANGTVQFWLLPSGEVRRPAEAPRDPHISLLDGGLMLSIDRLDDPDFGIYYCIVSTCAGCTDVVKVGINVDGPYYGEELFERYRRNAIVGGIAAGVVFVLMLTIWVLHSYIKCNTDDKSTDVETGEKGHKSQNGSAVPGNQADYDSDKLDGWVESTKIGDSIYDSADGIRRAPAAVDGSIPEDYPGRRDDRLLSTDSGHYQTIGSLERDQKLLSESELKDDVKILKTVIRRDWSETADEILQDESCNQKVNETGSLNSKGVETIETDNDKSDDTFIETNVNKNESLDEVEYSVSSKMRRNRDRADDRDVVVIIDGDVIIEPSGAAVMVTTVPGALQTQTQPRDNVVASPAVAGNASKKLDVVIAPVAQQSGRTKEPGDIQQSSTADIPATAENSEVLVDSKSNEPLEEQTDDVVASSNEETTTSERKFSSAGSSRAEVDSNTNSSVDEDTLSKYQSVLASLVSKHSQPGSSVSGHSLGSRSSSADSTVFHEDDQAPGAEPPAVSDVHL